MYVRTYTCRSSYFSAWFEDNGKLLDIMPLTHSSKGLLVSKFPTKRTITRLKLAKSEWTRLPYEPCLVTVPLDPTIYWQNRLYLRWGFYQDKDLSSRTRKRVIPLDCLMDFLMEYLDSHEKCNVDIARMYDVYGENTHHIIPKIWAWSADSLYQKLLITVNRYLAEVL